METVCTHLPVGPAAGATDRHVSSPSVVSPEAANRSPCKSQRPITVLIVEDHPLMAEAIERVVQRIEKCTVVGVAKTPEEARMLATSSRPIVITLDLSLERSRSGGIRLARELRSLCPDSSILVCSASAYEGDVITLAEIGVGGYVTKDQPPSVVASAIQAVADGQTYFSPPADEIIRRILRTECPRSLSPDEVATLRLVARGLPNKEVAKALSVSERTLARRMNAILTALRVTTRIEAVARASQLGYLDDG